jgi:hypothetical protein
MVEGVATALRVALKERKSAGRKQANGLLITKCQGRAKCADTQKKRTLVLPQGLYTFITLKETKTLRLVT